MLQRAVKCGCGEIVLSYGAPAVYACFQFNGKPFQRRDVYKKVTQETFYPALVAYGEQRIGVRLQSQLGVQRIIPVFINCRDMRSLLYGSAYDTGVLILVCTELAVFVINPAGGKIHAGFYEPVDLLVNICPYRVSFKRSIFYDTVLVVIVAGYKVLCIFCSS